MSAVEMIQCTSLAVILLQRSSNTGPHGREPGILVKLQALSN